MRSSRPSDLELQVLSVLWERGPSTAREVLTAMPDGKKRAYTTILSVLQVMEKKRLARHTKKGVTHVYRAAVSKRQVLRPLLRGLVANVFGGSPSAAMQQLLNATEVDAQELAKVQQLLETLGQPTSGENEGARTS